MTAGPVTARPGPHVPRLADPELRSRLVGYLGRARTVRPGVRTDGRWSWPAGLAEQVRRDGVGPDQRLLDHCLAQGLVLPAEPPVATGGPVPGGRLSTIDSFEYRGVSLPGADEPSDLLRTPLESTEDGTSTGWLTPIGWARDDARPAGVETVGVSSRRIPPGEAAELADELCRRWHDDLLAVGGGAPVAEPGPRLATLFDRASDPRGGGADRPWFSADRRRILEAVRRDRLAAYLLGGRLVVRAAGRIPDPLGGGDRPVVPLGFRTDGVWVWQEALAYYVQVRGVAPELALLCHIEERAYQPVDRVPDDVARAAASRATQPSAARPPQDARYLTTPTGELFRQRAGQVRPEYLDDGLRWRRFPAGWALPDGALDEISEADVVTRLDARWVESVSPVRA